MRDILLYVLAIAWIPVTTLAVTFFVSHDTDRMIAKSRRDNAARNAKLAR